MNTRFDTPGCVVGSYVILPVEPVTAFLTLFSDLIRRVCQVYPAQLLVVRLAHLLEGVSEAHHPTNLTCMEHREQMSHTHCVNACRQVHCSGYRYSQLYSINMGGGGYRPLINFAGGFHQINRWAHIFLHIRTWLTCFGY